MNEFRFTGQVVGVLKRIGVGQYIPELFHCYKPIEDLTTVNILDVKRKVSRYVK